MATTTDRTHGRWTVTGLGSYGEQETTTVKVIDNPLYDEDPDGYHRYLTVREVDGDEAEDQGADELAEALAYAAELVEQATAEYAENRAAADQEQRDERRQALVDATDGWEDDEATQAVEALAAAILDGRAAEALAALRAAGFTG